MALTHIEYWIASDGEQFEDEFDAQEYEFHCEWDDKFNMIDWRNEDGESITLECGTPEELYNNFATLYLPNEDAVAALEAFGNWYGWLVDGVDKPGLWMWSDEYDGCVFISSDASAAN